MLKLCRVDIESSKEIFERIIEYKNEVIKELNPVLIILFGSFARGDINEGSDVDIIAVADFKENFLERIKRLLDININVGLPLEPIGYTPEEFEEMVRRGNPFLLKVLEEGKILYYSPRKVT